LGAGLAMAQTMMSAMRPPEPAPPGPAAPAPAAPAAPAAAGATKFCIECGKPMPARAKFCPGCGGAQE
jgi:membrane protease subunit (stomatin/prohibitin family)